MSARHHTARLHRETPLPDGAVGHSALNGGHGSLRGGGQRVTNSHGSGETENNSNRLHVVRFSIFSIQCRLVRRRGYNAIFFRRCQCKFPIQRRKEHFFLAKNTFLCITPFSGGEKPFGKVKYHVFSAPAGATRFASSPSLRGEAAPNFLICTLLACHGVALAETGTLYLKALLRKKAPAQQRGGSRRNQPLNVLQRRLRR